MEISGDSDQNNKGLPAIKKPLTSYEKKDHMKDPMLFPSINSRFGVYNTTISAWPEIEIYQLI